MEKCPKCGRASVIELPKETKFGRRRVAKKPGFENFRADLLRAIRKIVAVLNRTLPRIGFAIWRIKIATYYFFTPIPEELK